MGPVVVNGIVPTAGKQHQRKNIPICVRIEWRVLCELGLTLTYALVIAVSGSLDPDEYSCF